MLLGLVIRRGGGNGVEQTAVLPRVVWITDALHLVAAGLQDTVEKCECDDDTNGGCGGVRWTHAVVGADVGRGRAWTGAEVEGGDGEAAPLQTHHTGSTRGSVLHVTQIRPIIQERMTPPGGQKT